MERTFEITAANGNTYKFVEIELGNGRSICQTYVMREKWYFLNIQGLRTIEDAKTWIEKINKEYNKPVMPMDMSGCAKYYGVGRYNGD